MDRRAFVIGMTPLALAPLASAGAPQAGYDLTVEVVPSRAASGEFDAKLRLANTASGAMLAEPAMPIRASQPATLKADLKDTDGHRSRLDASLDVTPDGRRADLRVEIHEDGSLRHAVRVKLTLA